MTLAMAASVSILISLLLGCGDKPGTSGTTDDTGTATTTGIDADFDGFTESEDCDDNNAAVNPDATEVCNGHDDDCDGLVDDDDDSLDPSLQSTFYTDTDGDGYGLDGSDLTACSQPDGTATVAGDCDDTDAAVNTAATEVCNGFDDDCDGLVDDDDDSLDLSTTSTFFVDLDGDGYGDDTSKVVSCDAGKGGATVGGDCNDNDDSIFPGAEEICDGLDNDCDDTTTEDGLITVAGVNQASLSDALDAARPSDQIVLCAGTYTGPFTTTKNTNILGIAGADATILTARGSAILTPGDDLTVEGLTFSGGSGDYTGGIDGVSGGVAATITVNSCTFDSNRGAFGGAILSYNDGTLNVSDSTFTNNSATTSGGAIYMQQGSISGSTLTGNTANFGGALMVDGGTVTVDADTLISSNTATLGAKGTGAVGGGVLLNGGTLNLDPATQITANEAYYGAGGAVYSVEDTTTGTVTPGTLTGGEITLNTATASGGGLVVIGQYAIASDFIVSGNSANWGGGVSIQGSDDQISFGEITDNSAIEYGGGIIFPTDSTGVSLTSLTVDGNTAAYGGAVAAEATDEFTMEDCQVTSNTADTFAGGFYLESSTATLRGGAVSSNVASDGDGGGAWMHQSTLRSVDVDWGVDTSDNDPSDVYLEAGDTGSTGTDYSYGSSATFTCDSTECR